MRFKIDVSPSSVYPIALYARRPMLWGLLSSWIEIDRFDTAEKARAKYEKIKDLPEYLP